MSSEGQERADRIAAGRYCFISIASQLCSLEPTRVNGCPFITFHLLARFHVSLLGLMDVLHTEFSLDLALPAKLNRSPSTRVHTHLRV